MVDSDHGGLPWPGSLLRRSQRVSCRSVSASPPAWALGAGAAPHLLLGTLAPGTEQVPRRVRWVSGGATEPAVIQNAAHIPRGADGGAKAWSEGLERGVGWGRVGPLILPEHGTSETAGL